MQRDLTRIGGLVILNGLVLIWIDQSNVVIIQALLIGLFMVGGSHITRRVLFPRVDLQEYAVSAKASPIGSAIVFAAILLFLIAVMFVGMQVLS